MVSLTRLIWALWCKLWGVINLIEKTSSNKELSMCWPSTYMAPKSWYLTCRAKMTSVFVLCGYGVGVLNRSHNLYCKFINAYKTITPIEMEILPLLWGHGPSVGHGIRMRGTYVTCFWLMTFLLEYLVSILRATSHMSQESWPRNVEDPWLSSKGRTMGVGKAVLCSHGPSSIVWSGNGSCCGTIAYFVDGKGGEDLT